MARRLAPAGRVYSTEIDARRLEDIRSAVAEARLQNVTVLEGATRTSNLPEGCCDAVYMREVYHHFEDPEPMVASLRAALKPGGLLAVIDYPERGRSGGNCHCIDQRTLVDQLTSWGFEAVTQEDRWAGTRYLAVFRKR
jgi:SAM-dependent methyltransferase